MVLDLCGGEAGEVVSAGAEPAWRRSAALRFARLAALGGAAVGDDEAVEALTRLGFAVEARDEAGLERLRAELFDRLRAAGLDL